MNQKDIRRVNRITFNELGDCFTTASNSAVNIYEVNPLQLLTCIDYNLIGSVEFAQVLNHSNIIIFCSGAQTHSRFNPHTLIVWNDQSQSVVFSYVVKEMVMNGRILKNQLIIITLNTIYIFRFPPIFTDDGNNENFLKETNSNVNLLSKLSTGENRLGLFDVHELYEIHQLLVFPDKKKGSVHIIDLFRLNETQDETYVSHINYSLQAHEHELSSIKLSIDQKLLATASSTGTLIRLFNPLKRECLLELRRGLEFSRIYSIDISPQNRYLAISSDRSTIHIWWIGEVNHPTQKYVGKSMKNYLIAPTLNYAKKMYKDIAKTMNDPTDPSNLIEEVKLMAPVCSKVQLESIAKYTVRTEHPSLVKFLKNPNQFDVLRVATVCYNGDVYYHQVDLQNYHSYLSLEGTSHIYTPNRASNTSYNSLVLYVLIILIKSCILSKLYKFYIIYLFHLITYRLRNTLSSIPTTTIFVRFYSCSILFIRFYSITHYELSQRFSNELNQSQNQSLFQQAAAGDQGKGDATQACTSTPVTHPDGTPSRVIHIRNLPPDTTDVDLLQFGSKFGEVVNLLYLKGKNQAFLEMNSLDNAQRLVKHYTTTQGLIRSRPVFVQFSNHQKLKTNSSTTDRIGRNDDGEIEAVLPSPVLRAIIHHLLYPVTLEVFQTIFSKYGPVLRIITFNRNDRFQALIEMKDAKCAADAKKALHGQNIYTACCTLQLEYSKLQSLTVKYNNDKSCDFTNMEANHKTAQDVWTNSYPSQNPMQTNTQLSALQLVAALHPLQYVNPPNQGASSSNSNALSPMHLINLNSQLAPHINTILLSTGKVLLVTNLNDDLVTLDGLFTLFGVYGDVYRVKILYQNKTQALVEFSTTQGMVTAKSNLDDVRLWGKNIKIFHSKYTVVQMPKDNQDAGLTKDYTSSNLHRFKKPRSKNFNNIFPPSQYLHLSNIPPKVNEGQIIEAFGRYGTVKTFRFFPTDQKMGVIQMSSIEEALHALIGMHNCQLVNGIHLRVTFSKAH
ncbi:hypothetical protein SNEBB_009252 [Seison nebaliae]|nr:hypothetical protein SNEBB_009252 [Seison nebaliae]